MTFQIKTDLATNSIPATYAILSLPEGIQSPFQKELFKHGGLPFHNLHLSFKQMTSSIDHIPFQVGSSAVLPKEFILGYKLCERKQNIHTRREKGCKFGQLTSPLSLVSNSDCPGVQRMGEGSSEAKELMNYLPPVNPV